MIMAINRIRNYSSSPSAAPKARAGSSGPSAAATIPQGFVMCPPQLAAVNAWQQEIYRLAYQQAQAAAQIPRHHRQLFSVWN
jgi:hypothetical protein